MPDRYACMSKRHGGYRRCLRRRFMSPEQAAFKKNKNSRRRIMKKVGVVMGSKSDLPVVEKGIAVLREYGVPVEVRVLSAHRCPEEARDFAASARESGFSVLIAAAGMAAHLAGALAANTTLPVIGIPCKSSCFDGMDALLSTVMMPSGIPVATVAVDGAKNAALLAIEIMAVTDDELAAKLQAARDKGREEVLKADEEIHLANT